MFVFSMDDFLFSSTSIYSFVKFAFIDTVASFFFVFFVTHEYIVSPIKKLHQQLEDISQNNTDQKRVSIDRNDEIGNLAKKINETLDALDQKQQLINRNSKLSAVGEMAGSVAHEINNPLTIITGYNARIKTQIESPQPNLALIGEYTKKIHATVFRIEKIIKSLRTISRNGEEDPLIPTPIGNIVDDVYFLSQMTLKTKSIVLDVTDIDPQLVINVRSVQISQVLINLINNAVDAVEKMDNPYIKVRSEETPEYIVLAVEDSGTMTEAVADKVMTPFFTTKEIGKGTGLGLSISKSIIEAHGGQFYLDRKSKTTCFKMMFPKKEAAQKAA